MRGEETVITRVLTGIAITVLAASILGLAVMAQTMASMQTTLMAITDRIEKLERGETTPMAQATRAEIASIRAMLEVMDRKGDERAARIEKRVDEFQQQIAVDRLAAYTHYGEKDAHSESLPNMPKGKR